MHPTRGVAPTPCENPTMARSADQPRRRARVLVEQVEDQTVLLDLDSGMYFTLNDVGARVWELCDGTCDIDGIAGAIAAEFDAGIEIVRADVAELVGELEAANLLEPR
jgi:hypothetical protein